MLAVFAPTSSLVMGHNQEHSLGWCLKAVPAALTSFKDVNYRTANIMSVKLAQGCAGSKVNVSY